MTGVRITVNDREVKDVLRALSRLGREPAAFLGPLGMQIINSTRERARRGVSPQGTPWPLLNPAYAATKRGTHMLRRDGNLLGGLTREVEGRRLRIGTSSVYGANGAGILVGSNLPSHPMGDALQGATAAGQFIEILLR